MMALLRLELARLFATPVAWWLLAGAVAVLAWSFLASIETTLTAQERLPSLPASVTQLIAVPVLGRSALVVAGLAVVLAPRWWALESTSGSLPFHRSSVLSTASALIVKALAASIVLLALPLAAAVRAASLRLGAPVDLGAISSGALGLFALCLLLAAIALAASVWSGSALASAALTAAVVIVLWAPDAPALARGARETALSALSISHRLHPLLRGQLDLAALGFFLAAAAVFVVLAWSRASRRSLRLRVALPVLVVLGAAGLGVTLDRGGWRYDLSASGRHSLQPASKAVLAELPRALTVHVPDDEGVPWRAVDAFLDRIRGAHPALVVEPVSPVSAPDRWRELGMTRDDIVLTLGDRSARTRTLTERDFMAAVGRLLSGRDARIAYVTGNGERQLRGDGPLDWGRLGDALTDRGLLVVPLDLVLNPAVPEDIDLLVLAPGSASPLPGTPEAIADWVRGGGRLLWATDPALAPGWAPVAEALSVTQLPGVLVDARAQDRGEADPRLLRVPPVTGSKAAPGFELIGLGDRDDTLRLPRAAAWTIASDVDVDWQAWSLLESTATTWNETGPLAGALAPDAAEDLRGPAPIALALARPLGEDDEQRVVLLGDGDLLATVHLVGEAHLAFGRALVAWLLARPLLPDLRVVVEPDPRLTLTPGQVSLLGGLWLFLLPGGLALVGILVWRHRARTA